MQRRKIITTDGVNIPTTFVIQISVFAILTSYNCTLNVRVL